MAKLYILQKLKQRIATGNDNFFQKKTRLFWIVQ